MRVLVRDVDWEQCPSKIAPYVKKSQTFVTVNREYEVHAVAVFNGLQNLLIVNDIGYPSWEKSWLFDVVDSSVPHDWICSLLHDEPALLLGPEFLAKDADSYSAMVELEAEQVDRFWRRVESLQVEPDESNST